MIDLTVKTLDSQNHSFSVEDDITVADFKIQIAETVNISAETQRLIYCGRVLQDESKLGDYNVNGKVVHLVQRAPPSANSSDGRPRSPSPQPSHQRRVLGGFDGGNAMYLGSMAFPTNLLASQGFVSPPPPTHSLAGSRLNVARRMLRRADAIINLLENPSARPNEQPPPEDQQEEVTPIIEARVIVPTTLGGGGNENGNDGAGSMMDEQMVMSAVQDSLFGATNDLTMSTEADVESTIDNQPGTAEASSTERSSPSTPAEEGIETEDAPAEGAAAAASSSSTTTAAEQRNGTRTSSRTIADNASRTSEMDDLLSMLNQLQVRFAPHLERYRNFMAEDPVVPSENARQTQAMITRVSEVLHYLGHAYHSLSDIIVRVRTPPPRPLLCRPILIQRSAVLQAGIPIQVEAQINLSAATERPRATDTANAGSTENSDPTAASGTTNSNSNSSNSEDTTPSAPPPPQMSQQQNQPTVNFRSFPLIPGASMRLQSFPIEVRASPRPASGNGGNNGGNGAGVTFRSSSSLLSAQNNGSNATSPTTAAGGTTAPATAPNNASNSAATGTPTGTGGGAENNTATFSIPNFNNSSVEVFMEVTPEVLQGTLNGPPPEFLQSLIQMAGQIMDRVTTTAAGASTTSSDGTNNTNDNNATSTSADASHTNVTSQTIPGQNSQARGNTQTNPTTATHTRSTPRPHVHLAQQAMQGGFDPFLPCNSHHVTHHNGTHGSGRRRAAAQTSNAQTQSSSQNGGSGAVQGQQATNASSRQGQNNRGGQQQRSSAHRITTPWDLQTFISNLPQNRASTANSTQGSTQPRSNDTAGSQQQNRNNTNSGANNDSPSPGIFSVVDQIINDVRASLGRPRATSQDGSAAADSEDGETGTTQEPSRRSSAAATGARRTTENIGNNVTVDDVGSDAEADGSLSFGSYPSFQVALDNIPNILQGPTIAEILQQLPPDDNGTAPRPGESIITDLIMLLSRNLTIVDMIALNNGNFEPLNKVANEMQSFFMTRILDGSTSQEAINAGVDRIVNEMQPFLENFSRLRIRDDINMVRSVECLFRRRLPDIITTAANLNAANLRAANMRNLVNKCVTLTKMICTLALNASENGQQGVEETFRQIIASYMEGIPVELQTWTMMTSCANLRHFMRGMDMSASDVQQYIVRNNAATPQAAAPTEAAAETTTTVPMATPKPSTTERENFRKEESKTVAAAAVPTPATSSNSEPMDLDEPEFTSGSAPASAELGTVEDGEVLPNVVLGSESWHDQVPQDWVPIITRDVQRQRRQSPQGPFSDAYLSSMPTKRRRIVASSKPQGSLPQVISESVRHAVTSTGLQSVAPLDAVSQAAGDSVELQTAYRNLLRSTVQTALRDNEDFTPDRFPNAATYFKPQQ